MRSLSCVRHSKKPRPPAASTIRGLKSPEQRDGDDGDDMSAALEARLPRFGPVYGKDILAIQTAKDLAWEHILQVEDDTEDDYLSSIMKIQTEAMESYDTTRLKPGSEFQWMMLKDGCFFLHLALYILGAGPHLRYSDQHPYFGKDRDSSYWIPSMFFVGNQIPYVVISALLKHKFFQNVIHGCKWRRPPQDPAKLVLYRIVVEPELNTPALLSPRSDILHALHCLLLGPGNNDPLYSEMKEFPDLEAGGDDNHIRFPSAGELLKSGIWLRKAHKGITNIHFRNLIIHARLYVPPLTIDNDTEHVLRSLASYEQNLNESDREVTAYFRFMRDLAPTYKDFKILERSGIIEVKENESKYTMLITLNQLVASHKCNFTLNFRDTRRKIAEYEKPPWGIISLLVGLITMVNTTFAVLSYFKHDDKK